MTIEQLQQDIERRVREEALQFDVDYGTIGWVQYVNVAEFMEWSPMVGDVFTTIAITPELSMLKSAWEREVRERMARL